MKYRIWILAICVLLATALWAIRFTPKPPESQRASIDPLIVQLGDAKLSVRRKAVKAVIERNFPQEQLVDAFIEHLKNVNKSPENYNYQVYLYHAVPKVLDESALPILLKKFKDKDLEVRQIVHKIFSQMKSEATPAVPGLIKILKRKDGFLDEGRAGNSRSRDKITNTLIAIGPPAVPTLVSALRDRNPKVRLRIAEALGEIRTPTAQIVPALIKALGDKDSSVRHNAAVALWRIGEPASAAVDALIVTLEDSDIMVRRSAAHALEKIGPGAADALFALIRLVKDEDLRQKSHDYRNIFSLRFAIIDALPKIGPETEVVVATLTQIFTNKNEPHLIRINAASALGDIGPPAISAVPVFIEVFKSRLPMLIERSNSSTSTEHLDEIQICSNALSAIGKIGPQAAEAIPVLIQAALLPDGNTDDSVARALGGIGAPAIPALVKALADANPDMRQWARIALSEMKVLSPKEITADIQPSIKQAIEVLIPTLAATDTSVSASAARALGKLGTPAIPALINALSDPRVNVRQRAVQAFGQMGPVVSDALPALIQGLNHDELTVSDGAFSVLNSIGTPEAFTAIAYAITHNKHERIRASAAGTFQEVSPLAEAIAALIQALSDEHKSVRGAAYIALMPIERPEVMKAIEVFEEINY